MTYETKSSLLKAIQKLKDENDGYGIQKMFETENDGGCPCFSASFVVDGKLNEVHGRCHRVSQNVQDLHFFGDIEIGNAIKSCLDEQQWYNSYTLIIHDSPFLDGKHY